MSYKNPHPGKFVVYCATNKVSSKSYIGVTGNFTKRKYEHLSSKRKKYAFECALSSYGRDNFRWVILEEHSARNDANDAESFFISYLGTLMPQGYNLDTGGNSKSLSDETKRKISKIKKGKILPRGKLHGNYGRKQTAEQKACQIASQSGDLSSAKKINSTIAKNIYLDYLAGTKTNEIRRKYCVSEDIALRIARKETWKSVSENLPNINLNKLNRGESSTSSKITEAEAISFIEKANLLTKNNIKNKYRQSKIIFTDYSGLSAINVLLVYKILTKRRWTHLSHLISE